jgi:hypothetical protein
VPITHTNAKGQTFSLYQGTTKTGKPKYYFAMQSEGTLAKAIPAGYEIYENPNAQVFLRRIPPKIMVVSLNSRDGQIGNDRHHM